MTSQVVFQTTPRCKHARHPSGHALFIAQLPHQFVQVTSYTLPITLIPPVERAITRTQAPHREPSLATVTSHTCTYLFQFVASYPCHLRMFGSFPKCIREKLANQKKSLEQLYRTAGSRIQRRCKLPIGRGRQETGVHRKYGRFRSGQHPRAQRQCDSSHNT